MNKEDIYSDPERFQYKRTGEKGVTSKLDKAELFNPAVSGGPLSVWRDPADGKVYVVNGHNRLHLAKRTDYDKPLQVSFINAKDAAEARGIGAIENIAQGTGTVLDAATILRELKLGKDDLAKIGLSISDNKIADAAAIASLEEGLYRLVKLEIWDPSRGALIGRAGLSPKQQEAVMADLESTDAKRRMPDNELVDYLRMAQSSEIVQTDMFGTGQSAFDGGGFGDGLLKANVAERSRLASKIKDTLRRQVRSTGNANKNADFLEAAGDNRIDKDANAKVGTMSKQTLGTFDTLMTQVGPVSDALKEGARRLAEGEKIDAVFPSTYRAVIDALNRIAPSLNSGDLAALGEPRTPEADPGLFGASPPSAEEVAPSPADLPPSGRAPEPPDAPPTAPEPQEREGGGGSPRGPEGWVWLGPVDTWTGTDADWGAGGMFREELIKKFEGPNNNVLKAELYDFEQVSDASKIKFLFPKQFQKMATAQINKLRKQPGGVSNPELTELAKKYLRPDLTIADTRRFPMLSETSARNWQADLYRFFFGIPRTVKPPRSPKGGGGGEKAEPPTEGQGQAKPYPGKVTGRGKRGAGEVSTATVDVYDPDGGKATYEVRDTADNGGPLREKALRQQAWEQHIAAVAARADGERAQKASAQLNTALAAGKDPRLAAAVRSGQPIPEHALRSVLADNGINPDFASDVRALYGIREPPVEVPMGHTYLPSIAQGFVLPPRGEPLRNVVIDSFHGASRVQSDGGPMGPGRYTYPSRADAEEFGPKVDPVRVTLNKPFVIRGTSDMKGMLDKARIEPWTDEEEAIVGLTKLREALNDWDYDGIVLNLDVMSKDDALMRLAFVDTRDQVIEFKEDGRRLAPRDELPPPPPGMPPDLASARLTPEEVAAARNSRTAQRFRYMVQRSDYTGALDEVSPVDLVNAYRYTPSDPNTIPRGSEADINRGPDGVDPRDMVTRRQIAEELGSRIDATFRAGKLRNPGLGLRTAPPGLRGWYAWRAGYGRVRSLRDIGVLAHEFGHALDSLLFSGLPHEDGVPNPAPGRRPPGQKRFGIDAATWKEWEAELAPLAVGVSGGDNAEGMAQFVKYYVTNSSYAKAAAPKFFEYFEKTMGKRAPEILDTLKSAGEKFQTYWTEMSPTQRATASMVTGLRPKQGLGIKGFLNDILRQYFRRNQPFHNAVDTTYGKEQRTWWGKRIPYSNVLAIDNPAVLEQNLGATTAGVVRSWLTGEGQVSASGSVDGRSLKDIWSPYANDAAGFERFGTYCLAKRTLEVHKELGLTTPVSLEDARATVAEIEASDPRAAPTHDLQREYQNNLVRYLADHGVVDKDKTEKLIARFRDYVPMYRAMEAFERVSSGGGQPSASTMGAIYNPIRHMRGGDRDVINPMEGIVKNAMTFINVAHRNEVSKALYKMGSAPGGGEFVRHLPAPLEKIEVDRAEVLSWIRKDLSPVMKHALEAASGGKLADLLDLIIPADMLHVFRATRYNPSEPVLSAFINGKEQLMEVNPDLYEVAHGLPKKQLNAVIRGLGLPARTLRAGATGINVEFVTKNLLRDQIFGHINSRYVNLPGVNAVRGLYHMLGRTDEYQEFLRSGLDGVARVSMDHDSLAKETDKLVNATRGNNVSSMDRAKDVGAKVISSPIEAMRFISERAEMISRLGALTEAKRIERSSGYVPGKGAVGISTATVAGREASPDDAMRSYRELTLRGAMAARESTVDFSMMGSSDLTQFMSATTAFWNARLQGTARSTRSLVENPLGTVLKTLAFVTLPSLMHYIYSHDDGQVADRPAWERRMFWLFPTKVLPTELYRKMQLETPRELALYVEKYPVVRVPKPEFFGDLGGTLVEDTIDYVRKKDPRRFKQDAAAFIADVGNYAIPTGLAVPWAIGTNKDSLTNRPIVPKQFSNVNLDPSEMATVNTSPTAIALASAYNGALPASMKDSRMTPMALEYAVRGWGGAVGFQVLNAVDFAASWADGKSGNKLGTRPETYWREMPIFRSFFSRHPSSSAEPIQDFWDLYSNIKEAHDTPKYLEKGDPTRSVDYLRAHPDFALVYSDIEASRKTISETNAMLRVINKSSLPPAAKRQALDAGVLYLIGQCRKATDDTNAKVAMIRAKLAERRPPS